MKSKQDLFDELLPLMQENGIDLELLHLMQEPDWLPEATVENLRFLLDKHRALKASRDANQGLYEKWQKSKQSGSEQ
jgi:hypothetical protein